MGATSLLGRMPNKGNKTSGNRAVTAIAVPSPIHQMAMSAVTTSMRCPSGVKPAGVGMMSIVRKITAPVARTETCLLNEVAKPSPLKSVTRGY